MLGQVIQINLRSGLGVETAHGNRKEGFRPGPSSEVFAFTGHSINLLILVIAFFFKVYDILRTLKVCLRANLPTAECGFPALPSQRDALSDFSHKL